ncbi:MAG: alpha/beta hydrolase [Burkholderiales bacterium]|nr:alpha/beta hydrolase [Burkholderiales bacterium]GIK85986.1 MAG: lipase [Betaproteobacteria bacterium]
MLDADVVRLLATVFGTPPAMPPDVAALRAAAEAAPGQLGAAPETVDDVRDLAIDGGARPPIPVRVYRPRAAAGGPALLFAHGGGWVTGSLASHDALCRQIANRVRATLVAVDYALAPERRYPAALDDVDAAWSWLAREAARLGADAARLAVAGDSSGGNLVAALTLRLRARGAPQPAAQLLLYPALDRRADAPSYERYATGYNLTAAMMRWYWAAYAPDGDDADAELSPLAAPDLAGLAPAVVAVAAADVLHDEGVAYAKRLHEDGVPARLVLCDGMVHGFLRWTRAVPAAQAHVDAACAELRRLLDPPPGL